jgi:polysaccharide biosynthesis PFTS motif protein
LKSQWEYVMSNSNFQKIIIIEKIDAGFFPLAYSSAENGCQVCFFSIDENIRSDPRVQKNLENGVFIDLSKVLFDYILFMNAAASAHENLDMIFEKFFSRSPTIRITKRLFESSDIENMYKKDILLYLNNLYFLEYKINTYIQIITLPIVFYPADGFDLHSDISAPLSKKVTIVRYKNLKVYLTDYRKRIEEYGLLLYPLYIFFRKVKGISFRKKPEKTYRLGINVNLPAMFSWNYHYISYLVDTLYGFPKDEIIFVDETYRKEIPLEFNAHGFAYENFLHQRVSISPKFLGKIVCHFIPAWLKCMFYCLTEEWNVVKTTRLILSDYIRWNMLMDYMGIQNHITILLPDRISKNLILSSHGCRTCYIYPDNYSIDYHTGWDENIPASIEFTFMNPEFAFVFGQKIKRFFSYNKNQIKHCCPLGVFSAQRVNEIRVGKIDSSLKTLLVQKKLTGKIIGIFDSGFIDWGPNKVKDGIRFAEEILLLLDEMPEISIIFKEKRFIDATPQLKEKYLRLLDHPRCLFVKKQENDCVFATEVIALSDLVISVAYTSTTVEALASKTNAIYYDVAGNDIGDHFYYNQFPNLVAHDYSQLKHLINYWLYNVKPEEFESYLDTYVKGEIDPYLDMKAIDRLQAQLRS